MRRKLIRNGYIFYKTDKLPVYYSTSALYGIIERNILNVTRMSFKFLSLHQCLNNEIHHNMVFSKLNTRQTRAVSRGRLRLPEIQTTRYVLEGIKYKTVKIYNELPITMTTTNNIKNFKKMLHQWIVNNQN